jgi:hypothetical protein
VLLAHSLVGTEFRLSEEDFRATEPPDMTFMPVFIEKGGSTLVNEVLFRITPLTVREAETRNIVNFTRPVTHANSPSLAGTSHTLVQIWGAVTETMHGHFSFLRH